ncbi:glutamyl-tRNA reductase [Halobacillus litoralis]|uniref:Glutamyl-tRNA reductase n=1 Tax=Halobacillus litoralis TaxID=45668 RepID=A0A410MHA4_9BACI|nr:glutamyl-tRNA reductase [Halobacillus litoralis]QAS54026.1 glutamyl-tRNA reductase [Halobacillus litoralis]
MHILAVGLNYRTAPVEIREKLTFSEGRLEEAMSQLNTQKSVLENVIISTCNRTEIYAVVDQLHTGRYYIKQFLADWFNVEKNQFSPFLSIYETDGAIEHLLRVTSGLDSMVLGETQILGQMKQSFLRAQEAGSTGTIFNQLFKQSVTMAKKAHKETEIGDNAVSVSYAAVELARKIFGDLVHKHIVILGAGKMGELAAKNLHGSGVRKVSVVNRTLTKAQQVADQFSGDARTMDELEDVLRDADIVISSTGASEYVITRELMEPIHRKRKGKPLFFVDIAVPRDLDPAMETLESVFLYDIDDLQGIVDANLALRKQAAEEIEVMIEAEIVEFKQWLQTIGVVPVISALRSKALGIQNETMKSIERKMPDLSDRERKVLNKHTKSIINQMLKEPISQAKELAAQPDSEESLRLFTQIFGIEEQVEKEVEEQEKKSNVTVKHSSEASEPISIINPMVNS